MTRKKYLTNISFQQAQKNVLLKAGKQIQLLSRVKNMKLLNVDDDRDKILFNLFFLI